MRRSVCRLCHRGCHYVVLLFTWTHDEPADHPPIPEKP